MCRRPRTCCRSGSRTFLTLRFIRIAGFGAKAEWIICFNRTVKLNFRVSGRAGRLPIGRPATVVHSERSPGRPTRIKITVRLFTKGRSLRGTQQSRERLILRASAAGGCGPSANADSSQRTVQFIAMFSLSQAGATPGEGLQLRYACFGSAGSGHKINCTIITPHLSTLRPHRSKLPVRRRASARKAEACSLTREQRVKTSGPSGDTSIRLRHRSHPG